MSSIKKAMMGNFAAGIVIIAVELLSSFFNMNANDFLAVLTGIIILIVFFISLRLVIQNSKLHNEYTNGWICTALRLIRMVGVVIYLFGFVSKSDIIKNIVFTIIGFTFLLEAGYWRFFVLHKGNM
ncbi:hypothetical protein V6C42_09680 [Pseudoclostridium thermosuccinogenes]|uniref:hypothetical protein n=1 Tax=Clostridium thermosuccinogenes TaxID=84032 RepID=UPI000CCC40C3|nr:hypothetical protein [Pseudoclostridium thermosuccinogenes]PNT92829.1 hypothetical protein CDQ83_04520 [Pseudoclostridium thermosuccinogenes]